MVSKAQASQTEENPRLPALCPAGADLAESAREQGLKPTERLFLEKTLIRLYPRVKRHDLFPWKWFHGPLIPDFIVQHTDPSHIRRIVEIGCGDGLFTNVLSLLYPDIEIIGIDADRHQIAKARATVGYRRNLKFVCANAAVLTDIPCDRIIYNHCLAKTGGFRALKKLIVKTTRWLVDEGDFILREAPWELMLHPEVMAECYRKDLWAKRPDEHLLPLLQDLGYAAPILRFSKGLPGYPSEVFYRASASLVLRDVPLPARKQATVAEWQGWEEQSNDSLVGFLFANREPDFSRGLV